MAVAEINGDGVRLCLKVEMGRGQLTIEPIDCPSTTLPCSIINLFAVIRGIRYHIASLEGQCTLEREADSVRVHLQHSGNAFDYLVPADQLETAVQLLAHDAQAAALGKKSPSSHAYVL